MTTGSAALRRRSTRGYTPGPLPGPRKRNKHKGMPLPRHPGWPAGHEADGGVDTTFAAITSLPETLRPPPPHFHLHLHLLHLDYIDGDDCLIGANPGRCATRIIPAA